MARKLKQRHFCFYLQNRPLKLGLEVIYTPPPPKIHMGTGCLMTKIPKERKGKRVSKSYYCDSKHVGDSWPLIRFHLQELHLDSYGVNRNTIMIEKFYAYIHILILFQCTICLVLKDWRLHQTYNLSILLSSQGQYNLTKKDIKHVKTSSRCFNVIARCW